MPTSDAGSRTASGNVDSRQGMQLLMPWEISTKVVEGIGRIIAAGYPLILIETWEEERLDRILSILAERNGLEHWVWSSSEGFTSGPGAGEALREPEAALEYVKKNGAGALTLMRDLPAYFAGNQQIRRLVRDVYDDLSGSPGALAASHPGASLPDDIRKEVHVMALPLPDREELASYLTILNGEHAEAERFSAEWVENCSAEMKSFTTNECRLLFNRLRKENAKDLGAARTLIRQQRAQALMKENCLEVVDTEIDLDSIGGLNNLKNWVTSRHQLFGLEARRAGIAPPSGMLMMGVSGCGKSLAAKAIASAWQLPLVRLDMNLIMSGACGSPESAWARTLSGIESVAPVIVWLDEIENSFGYVDGHSTGGNLTIFSSFLTWMQEKTSDVFVVATANNIDLLPAEMLRKGRFDELFFLDLPKPEARAEVLAIHIRNQGGEPGDFDLAQLAELLEGWTASEMEQLVRAARLEAFYARRDFTFADLKNTSFKMVPLSKTMSEQINELRRWARTRAASAD